MANSLAQAVLAQTVDRLLLATTLEERATGSVARATPPGTDLGPDPVLQAWLDAVPLDSATAAKRFAALGGPASFARTLHSPVPPLAPHEDRERWVEALLAGTQAARGAWAPRCWTDEGYAGELLLPLRPLLDAARTDLELGVRSLDGGRGLGLVERDEFIEHAERDLFMSTFDLADRALVAELGRARSEGRLRGDTARERFLSHVHARPVAERFGDVVTRYPVLGRWIVDHLDERRRLYITLLGALLEDGPALAEFDPRLRGAKLRRVDVAGDPHEGRAVCICQFEGGVRLAYKPRDGTIERAFVGLVDWLDQRGLPRPLRAPKVLCRPTHSWVEFIARAPCASRAEISDFYYAQGELLGLLYAIGAVDAHQENVVAAGSDPVLIDAESLLHPAGARGRSSQSEGNPSDPSDRSDRSIREFLGASVQTTGMLPIVSTHGAGGRPLHFGGIASVIGADSPVQIRRWAALGTDAVHQVRETRELPVGDNVPRLGERPIPALEFLDVLDEGFAAAHALIRTHAEALARAGGPLGLDRATRVRVVVRETRIYEMLRRESSHPSLLMDALDRDRFLDKLWRAVPARPELAPVVPHEHRALAAGHIPRFEAEHDGVDLLTEDGTRIPDYFSRSGREVMLERLRRLDAADSARQRWLTRATLAVAGFNSRAEVELGPQRLFDPPISGAPHLSARRAWSLRQSAKVVDRLAELAIGDERGSTWLGVYGSAEGMFDVHPLGTDLYEGLPGVILFLAHHAWLTGCPTAAALSERASVSLRELLASKASAGDVGAFCGWAGVVYTFSRLFALTGEDRHRSDALAAVARIVALPLVECAADVHSGLAGAIPCLLAAAQCLDEPALIDLARRCGLALVERLDALLGREPPGPGLAPLPGLCGVSHGAAGAAWALHLLALETGEPSFRAGADQAWTHERARFDAVAGNWPDLRILPPEITTPRGMCSLWCNGAAGIGLTRADSHRREADPELLAEIRAAVRATALPDSSRGHSLCHGAFGNLELHRLAVELGEISPEAYEAGVDAMLEEAAVTGLRWGTPMGVEVPGLMTGLAGIGYGLLRLADPRVPNVLLLEGSA